MSDVQHTPEPWKIGDGKPPFASWAGQILGQHSDGEFILATCNQNYPEDAKANARRIVACVNACRGIPTEDLEAVEEPGRQFVHLSTWKNTIQERDYHEANYKAQLTLFGYALRERDEARAMVAELARDVQELLDMANRHDCGECGGFLSSELDFVQTAEKAIAKAATL